MMIGLRSLGYAAGALETVSDSQGAAFGIYEIITAVSSLFLRLMQSIGGTSQVLAGAKFPDFSLAPIHSLFFHAFIHF